jgi:hypothetical protein
MARRRCADYDALISNYIDGELPREKRDELLAHLAGCESCRKTLESYRLIGSRIRAVSPVQPPVDLTDLILAQTVNTGPRRLAIVTNRLGYSLAAVAAVLLVFVVAVYLLVSGYQRSINPEVVASSPANHVTWPLHRAVEISFNKEMDHASVEAALAISPTLEHERLNLTWNGNTLIIGANQTLKPNVSYTISISQDAQDRWGQRLEEPFQLQFLASSTLEAFGSPTPQPTFEASPTAPPTETARAEQPTATPTPEIDDASIPPLPPDDGAPPAQSTDPTPAGSPVPPVNIQPTATPEPNPAQPDPEVPATATATPEPTSTPEPTVTPTTSPIPSPTPPSPTAEPSPTVTETLPPDVTPSPVVIPVTEGFGNLYWSNEVVQGQLGQPIEAAVAAPALELDFQHGAMFLRTDQGSIHVLLRSGYWSVFPDTSTDQPAFAPGPEEGTWTPGGPLGYLWSTESSVSANLGFAIEPEARSFQTLAQRFEFGTMVLSSSGLIYVIYDTGVWELYPDPGAAQS